jgi:glutamate-1-semialdehyde 2,1-aminomutase
MKRKKMNEKSWEKYKRSLNYLAGGSSTNSKKPVFEGYEPALIVKGDGCRIWDLDGNEYIDFRCGLGPVTLGYNIPEINKEIISQLKNGISFSYPHPLEGEVAEKLTEIIPCAEKVRFLKTGGEAIAACIKIARAFTGRNKIIQCGYNGWLNTLSTGEYLPSGIARSQPLRGVPFQISSLHFSFPWADIDKWKEFFAKEGSDIAAVVIASNYEKIEKGKEFLPQIRELTERYGSLMIMDEIVTGFRLAKGGAHEYFNFLPDMAVFSKGIANGMPLSAYLGKAELIELSFEIGISSTFGGETLSLASAKATIKFYKERDVISHLWEVGNMFKEGVNNLFKKYEFPAELKGFGVCPIFIFKDNALKEKFFTHCNRNGVALYNVSYVNYSHKRGDIEEALNRIEKAIKMVKDENN